MGLFNLLPADCQRTGTFHVANVVMGEPANLHSWKVEMTSKAIWLTTIGLSSLTLVAAVPLGQVASQLWKPEVAHAAKVTVRLVQTNSFNPLGLTRRSRSLRASGKPAQVSGINSQALVRYASKQILPLNYPAISIQPVSDSSLTVRPSAGSMMAQPRFNLDGAIALVPNRHQQPYQLQSFL